MIVVDTLSNTAESEKTKNLIDDPDRDVMYHCLREYSILGNAINAILVTCKSSCKR